MGTETRVAAQKQAVRLRVAGATVLAEQMVGLLLDAQTALAWEITGIVRKAQPTVGRTITFLRRRVVPVLVSVALGVVRAITRIRNGLGEAGAFILLGIRRSRTRLFLVLPGLASLGLGWTVAHFG